MNGHVQIEGERCKGCSLCIDFCPKGSISLSEELNLKGYFVATFRGDGGQGGDGAACNGCGNCALMCPEVAIRVMRS